MDMIYISHPYTGDEENNRASAERIAAEFAQKYPDVVFINPLNVMKHLKDTSIPYEVVLEQCKTLLARCEGIIMAGNWKDSRGCMEELGYAKEHHLPVWDNMDEFHAEHAMQDDCCGHHRCCRDCLCRTCAERVACWNCNGCTKPARKKHAIGFTGKDAWECSRYRNTQCEGRSMA